MKNVLIACTLFLTSGAALAQQGHYEFIPYWGNNPDLFCKYGVREDCWKPKDPQRGTYTVTDYKCFNRVSAAMYQRVCSSGSTGATMSPKSLARDPADASPGL